MDDVAAACVRPTTLGTLSDVLAATSSSTAEPAVAMALPSGDCPMTVPGANGVPVAWVTAPTTKPADVIALFAAACVKPVTLGTSAPLVPSEITSDTAVPGGRDCPTAGLCEITDPAGTLPDCCRVIVPTSSCAASKAARAASSALPVTLGTFTGATVPTLIRT